jgi:CxxC-x17-CxxC domain-containing protein
MDFVDRNLTCIDCGTEFVFSEGEQAFFRDKGFLNFPKRCAACRAKRKFPPQRVVRKETVTVCAGCGKETTVPFKPTHGKPVLCHWCFTKSMKETSQ